MMYLGKAVGAVLMPAAVLATLCSCQRQEGPAEHAGKEADKAAAKVGQQIEKDGENIQDTARRDKK